MNVFDRLTERLFKSYLHKKQDHHIKEAIIKFNKKHDNLDPKVTDELKKLLETEALRLYPMVDKSILRERIKRAKYVFIFTAIASAILATIIMILTHGTAIIFITPLFSALFAWIGTLATIPIGYEQRIIGGMDSIITVFEEKLGKRNSDTIENEVKNAQNETMQHEIDALKAIINNLNNKNENMQHEIDGLKDIVKESNETMHKVTYLLDNFITHQEKIQEMKLSPIYDSTLNENIHKHINFHFLNDAHKKMMRSKSLSSSTCSSEVKSFEHDTLHPMGHNLSCKA